MTEQELENLFVSAFNCRMDYFHVYYGGVGIEAFVGSDTRILLDYDRLGLERAIVCAVNYKHELELRNRDAVNEFLGNILASVAKEDGFGAAYEWAGSVDLLGIYKFLDTAMNVVKGKTELYESYVHPSRGMLVEMARMNLDDDETSPLPMNKFDVRVMSDDHEPKHIHVTPKGEETIRFEIESGDVYEKNPRLVGLGKKLEGAVKEWLDEPSATEPYRTNRETCLLEWRRLHEGND